MAPPRLPPAEMDTPATREIATLDPARDFERIAYLLSCYEFSWDIERALEFALFRSYAVPSISRVLAATGEFERRPRKRYDDTELLLSEMIEHGFDSAEGRAAVNRINEMHGRFRIADDEMAYVLSTFVLEPIRWLDRFGRRPMTGVERLGWMHYHLELGRRMGIARVPQDLDALDAFNRRYEAERFRFAETNRRIAGATTDLLIGFYLPRRLVRHGRPAVHAVLDDPLRRAVGAPPAPVWLVRGVAGAMALRRRLLRLLPPRRRPRHLTQVRRPTYAAGYRIEALGIFEPKRGGNPADSPDRAPGAPAGRRK